MNNPTVRNFLITCAALAVLALGAYAYLNRAPSESGLSGAATTTSQTLSDGTVIGGLPEGATAEEVVSGADAVVAPDFRKAIAYDTSVSAEVRAVIETRRAQDVQLLAKNKYDFNAWLGLAGLYKMGGDYRAAEAAWLYVTKVWPTSYVAFHSLGDLYENFLKDSAKAKVYYDKAAALGAPKQ